ncbi:glycosyltransferase [Puia dinghuensis]|uniref:Glycosyltransferase 2-like domain-containing protein n=1 Tax=Puia dinghuensis TaxID=1792502 RepID=A0A8J2XU17_9BACT|nr:glycosyltransferase [Puia dinghuensis]GGB08525.1 hypothetical protein GCM10011511_35000 [Puia dinghuensis]
MDHEKIGIVVPFYNGHEYLDRLIASVEKAAAGLHVTLFIVDNSPEGPPLEIARKGSVPVEIIRERPGIGYGKACNAGFERCKKAGFDYILVVNQDGYLSDGLIRGLLVPFREDKSIVITAPLLKTYTDDEVEDFFIKYYLSQAPAFFTGLLHGHTADHYPLQRISGACFAFSLRNGNYPYAYFFDPLFHMYYEDEELCQRIHAAGGKIVLVTRDAIFYHRHSHTNETEQRSSILKSQLVSVKILRLKDPSGNSFRAYYSIFIATLSSMFDHLLRGQLRLFYLYFRSLLVVTVLLPRIARTRRQDRQAAGLLQNKGGAV